MTTHLTPHISGCGANQYAAIGARLDTDLFAPAQRDLIRSTCGAGKYPTRPLGPRTNASLISRTRTPWTIGTAGSGNS